MDFNAILNVCIKYSQDGCYSGEYIPQNKLNNAKAHFPIPHQETVFLLIDTTVTGSAKCGIAVGANGVYWKNDWTTKTRQTHMSWPEFMSVDLQPRGLFDITLGPGNVLNTSGCKMKRADIIALLNEIRSLVASPTAQIAATMASSAPTLAVPPVPNPTSNIRWMLGVNGQQYGPYTVQDIVSMVRENRIDPSTCYVWREGMANWVLFNTVPELNALLHPQLPNVPPLPPVGQ